MVLPCRQELNFHFCSRTEKGLQHGSQNGAFWAPTSELYSLWRTICENLVPQKLHRKKGQHFREFSAPMWAARRNAQGHWGVRGVIKTADIGRNCAVGPARPVPCEQGAAD